MSVSQWQNLKQEILIRKITRTILLSDLLSVVGCQQAQGDESRCKIYPPSSCPAYFAQLKLSMKHLLYLEFWTKYLKERKRVQTQIRN